MVRLWGCSSLSTTERARSHLHINVLSPSSRLTPTYTSIMAPPPDKQALQWLRFLPDDTRPIPELPGFKAAPDGGVYDCRHLIPRRLSPRPDTTGRLLIRANNRDHSLASLVLTAFGCPRPHDDATVVYADKCYANCAISNLCWRDDGEIVVSTLRLANEPLTKAELLRRTGLSKFRLDKALERLTEAGAVERDELGTFNSSPSFTSSQCIVTEDSSTLPTLYPTKLLLSKNTKDFPKGDIENDKNLENLGTKEMGYFATARKLLLTVESPPVIHLGISEDGDRCIISFRSRRDFQRLFIGDRRQLDFNDAELLPTIQPPGHWGWADDPPAFLIRLPKTDLSALVGAVIETRRSRESLLPSIKDLTERRKEAYRDARERYEREKKRREEIDRKVAALDARLTDSGIEELNRAGHDYEWWRDYERREEPGRLRIPRTTGVGL